jgi:hypothetical protein
MEFITKEPIIPSNQIILAGCVIFIEKNTVATLELGPSGSRPRVGLHNNAWPTQTIKFRERFYAKKEKETFPISLADIRNWINSINSLSAISLNGYSLGKSLDCMLSTLYIPETRLEISSEKRFLIFTLYIGEWSDTVKYNPHDREDNMLWKFF